MSGDAAVRLALHTGGVFVHDAVSRSLLEKLDAVADARAQGRCVEARALVSHSDIDRADIAVRPGAAAVLRDPWFWVADLHVYEYGIWYEAFDTVFAVPPHARSVAWYHNVTPPELARDESDRLLLERSCGKKENLSAFDLIVCISPFSRDEVLDLGIPPERVSVVPLPPGIDLTPVERHHNPGDPVELLYVGRFSEAKGVLDLLEAASRAAARSPHAFTLLVAGNERLSDPSVVAEMRSRVARPDLATVVRLVGEPEDGDLARLYQRVDALVVPSHHEGYCVPAVEAIAAGAQVIGTDAGNLPNVLAGVGLVVPARDVDALAGALADLVARTARARAGEPFTVLTTDGVLDGATWRDRVEAHRRAHSREALRKGFWSAVDTALAAPGRDVTTAASA